MRFLSTTLIAISLLGFQQLQAQLPTPTLDTIYPAGGKAGATVDVVLTGTELDDLTELRFTHDGIKGEPVILPADEIWPEPRHDGLKFKVNIAENVPAGTYEARTIGKTGTSTPRFFVVSGKGGHDEINIAGGNETPETAMEIQLDQPVNAQTTASNSDHFKLTVKAGQRVLVHLWGERIDSRIDATLSVLDPNGNLVAESLNEIGLDPLADFTAAADGDYLIKVADYLYNGGGLYYYRLVATTAPHIDGVFPLAGKVGSKQKFTIYGRNLPGGQPAQGVETSHGIPLQSKEVEIQIPGAPQAAPIDGTKALQLLADGFNWKDGNSNNVRIGLAHDNVVVEDANLEEQTVTAPCEVAGRFDYSGDMDLYRFTAKKGEVFYLDVISDRIGVNSDPNLIVQQIIKPAEDAEDQSETTKFIAESDDLIMDSLAIAGGFDTRSRDSGLTFTAPVDGEYRVIVGNNFSSAGALAGYRLGIRAPKPGFKLIAVADKNHQEARNALPGVPILHAGTSTIVRVLALREDGFTAPIELSVEGLPEDVYAPPSQIWEQNDEGYLVISASQHAADWTGDIKITGKAKDGDREIVATATPGTLIWTAVDTTKNRVRSRLTSVFPLNVHSTPARIALAPDEAKVWQVDLQGALDIPVNLTRAEGLKGNAVVTPWGLPNFKRPAPTNVAVAKPEDGVAKISFRVDGNNKPMHSEGSFVFKVDGVMEKYKTHPEHIDRWTGWQKVVNAAATTLAAAKTKADAASTAATAVQTAADKAVTDNGTQHAALAKAATDAQTKFDAAVKAAVDAETAAKAVPASWLAVAKKAQADNAAAKPVLEKAAADAKTKDDAAKKAAADADTALKAAITAHEANLKKLNEAKAAADAALKKEQDAVAVAEKALVDFKATRTPLAAKASAEDIKNRNAQKAAGLATTAIATAATNHEANIKALTEAKTKADNDLKAPQAALDNAKKAVEAKKTANVAIEKAAADAQTKLDGLKKAAADADAAVKAAATAHAANVKKLTETKTTADTAQAAADKALAENTDEAQKAALEKAVADAKKAAADAAAAIPAAETAYKAEAAKLTAAKTTADTAAKTGETAFATAQKNVETAKAQLEPLVKTQTDAQAKFDPVKKAADEATAAIPAAEKANTDNVAKLNADKAEADKVATAAQATYDAAAKPLTDHEAKREALEKAIVDAKAKIEPAQKAVTAATTPVVAAETAHAANLAKLTTAKRTADIAALAPALVLADANKAVADNAAAVEIHNKAVIEAEAAVKAATDKLAALKTAAEAEGATDEAKKAFTDADAAAKADAAKVAALTNAKTQADAALKTAETAFTNGKRAQMVNEATKPILVAAAAEAKTKADAAKATAATAATLATKATAAKTLAAAELKKATDRAKEKDMKFTVFSEPIALRIIDPKK